ncbi:hypothetical protein ACEQ8H_007511 [Pleosporales sp. CAS-2024a]
MHHHDPHQRPPPSVRNVYKRYQKMKTTELDADGHVIDIPAASQDALPRGVRIVRALDHEQVAATLGTFLGKADEDVQVPDMPTSIPVYEHEDMPGLHMIPHLLPPSVQNHLLSRLLHNALSDPSHLTNIHAHYTLSYPPSSSSFFSIPPSTPDPMATPLDASLHRPLAIQPLLTKKLRWTTLGGQYDWTAKKYPDATPPAFPADVASLLHGVFPATRAQAAIVNLYSPGDTLSLHRDVAEKSATGLVSVSLGCDALFVLGTSGDGDGDGDEEMDKAKVLTMRLRSGSAVYMSGQSRFAWHGVPQIVRGTCPDYLAEWPGTHHGNGEYEQWKGWMAGKRVNLNVRQMWD